jgi:hypothetical protein
MKIAPPCGEQPSLATRLLPAHEFLRSKPGRASHDEGLSNKEIGGRLELSEKTIKHYLTILMDKLNVRTRVQAALLAYGRLNPVAGLPGTPSYARTQTFGETRARFAS